jgi:hypothetical protein
MPMAVNKPGLSLPTFDLEAAFLISLDCPAIVSKDSNANSMKSHVPESVLQHKFDRLRAEPSTKTTGVQYSDGH